MRGASRRGKVRIRNYDPERSNGFGRSIAATRPITSRIAIVRAQWREALEAAIEGASARVWAKSGGWKPFVRVMTTPELWVAAQVRNARRRWHGRPA